MQHSQRSLDATVRIDKSPTISPPPPPTSTMFDPSTNLLKSIDDILSDRPRSVPTSTAVTNRPNAFSNLATGAAPDSSSMVNPADSFLFTTAVTDDDIDLLNTNLDTLHLAAKSPPQFYVNSNHHTFDDVSSLKLASPPPPHPGGVESLTNIDNAPFNSAIPPSASSPNLQPPSKQQHQQPLPPPPTQQTQQTQKQQQQPQIHNPIMRKKLYDPSPEQQQQQQKQQKQRSPPTHRASPPQHHLPSPSPTSAPTIPPDFTNQLVSQLSTSLKESLKQELDDRLQDLRNDILNIHSEMVVMTSQHSSELRQVVLERDETVSRLTKENESLRADHDRLRRKYGLAQHHHHR